MQLYVAPKTAAWETLEDQKHKVHHQHLMLRWTDNGLGGTASVGDWGVFCWWNSWKVVRCELSESAEK